jgi:hypothetical protein
MILVPGTIPLSRAAHGDGDVAGTGRHGGTAIGAICTAIQAAAAAAEARVAAAAAAATEPWTRSRAASLRRATSLGHTRAAEILVAHQLAREDSE